MTTRSRSRPDRTLRLILKGAVAGSLGGLGFAAGTPFDRAHAAADASKWPKDAFQQKSDEGAIQALYGGKPTESADKIKLDAPEIAENGAVVPIAVSTTLPDVTSIAILVTENPNPLASVYIIPAGSAAAVANRLKMAKTSKVVAVVKAGGQLYSASKEVKVTVGGCGG